MVLPDGEEILLNKISGSTNYTSDTLEGQIFDAVDQRTIRGKHMAVTLGRLFVNLPLYYQIQNEVRCFTMLEVIWHNLWDYRMSQGDAKMIDAEGFQHSGKTHEYGFDQVYKPSRNELFSVKFAQAEFVLEPYARTRGWVWFDELPNGVLPRRLIFIFNIYDPGQTSGWIRDTETLEFVIENFEQTVIEQFP